MHHIFKLNDGRRDSQSVETKLKYLIRRSIRLLLVAVDAYVIVRSFMFRNYYVNIFQLSQLSQLNIYYSPKYKM